MLQHLFSHLVLQLKEHREELVGVLSELHQAASVIPTVRDLDLQENPEKNFEYTRESLLQFKADYEKRQAQERLAKSGNTGGFGNFGGAQAEEEAQPAPFETEKLGVFLFMIMYNAGRQGSRRLQHMPGFPAPDRC